MNRDSEKQTAPSLWLFRYGVFTAAATLALLGIGGMVTSKGAGMAVPDWPTSYGYNMFLFPLSYWVGGIFYEHTHRLLASFVGLLTVLLTRWVCGCPSRKPLALIGAAEVVVGVLIPTFFPALRGTGYFLSGIGAVVLLAAGIPGRNNPCPAPLPTLAWVAFWTVQLQGLLGGLRVVLFKDEIGVFHAALAQVFFLLICSIALLAKIFPNRGFETALQLRDRFSAEKLPRTVLIATVLIFAQLLIGASMRHRHAGLAIPDFPTAYGQAWPKTDPDSIAQYNSKRIEIFAAKPIQPLDIYLQMAHRIWALGILAAVGLAAYRAASGYGPVSRHGKAGIFWLLLILAQAALGAATVWTNKAADIATVHLIIGALSLAFGGLWCILLFVSLDAVKTSSSPPGRWGSGSLGNPSIASGEA